MIGTILIVVGAVVLTIAAVGVLWVLAMRAKLRAVRGLMIWFTRTIVNPMQMKTAGTPGAYAAVMRNRGRVSGKLYETPIVAVPVDDDFLIALPYGTQANWVRNVLAAESAELVRDGRVYQVDRPVLVPMSGVEDCFPDADKRAQRLTNVDQCLRLRVVQPAG